MSKPGRTGPILNWDIDKPFKKRVTKHEQERGRKERKRICIIVNGIDFLDFHWGGWHFWAFNVADSAITVGAAILIVDSFLPKREAQSLA